MIGTTVGQRVEESIDNKLAVGLLVVSVIFWLAGILRQKWGMRLCAWWSTMFLVLTELSDLILYALGIRGLSAAGKALSWGSFGLVSYMVLRYVVSDAYLRRLACVADIVAIRRYERIMKKHIRQASIFPIITASGVLLWYVARICSST